MRMAQAAGRRCPRLPLSRIDLLQMAITCACVMLAQDASDIKQAHDRNIFTVSPCESLTPTGPESGSLAGITGVRSRECSRSLCCRQEW